MCTSKLAAHDRLADRLVNPMTRGLPGGSGTSKTAGMPKERKRERGGIGKEEREEEREKEKGNEISDSQSVSWI